MSARLVMLDGMADYLGPVPAAYLDESTRWNGWLCPYFDQSTCERIAAACEAVALEDDEATRFGFDGSRWLRIDPREYDYHEGRGEYAPVEGPGSVWPEPSITLPDGSTAYALGGWCFTWERGDAAIPADARAVLG